MDPLGKAAHITTYTTEGEPGETFTVGRAVLPAPVVPSLDDCVRITQKIKRQRDLLDRADELLARPASPLEDEPIELRGAIKAERIRP